MHAHRSLSARRGSSTHDPDGNKGTGGRPQACSQSSCPLISVVVVVLVFVPADLDPQHFAVARRSRLVRDVQGTVLTDGDAAGKSQRARLELDRWYLGQHPEVRERMWAWAHERRRSWA